MHCTSKFAALLLSFVAWHAQGATPAPGLGTFTIVEGDLAVVRQARQLAAAEGMRVRADDIVRTGADAQLARLELDDGTVLDLGPGTELRIQPRTLSRERDASLYLVSGWLKVTAPPAGIALASSKVDVRRLAGTAVVRVLPQAALVLVETGRAEVTERANGKAVATYAVRETEAFATRAAGGGATMRRPPPDLIDGLPDAFAETAAPRPAPRLSQGSPRRATTELPVAVPTEWLEALEPESTRAH